MAAAIEFRGVNKWFGPLHVLQDVDLTVEAGEVVVVCGPSGSGKSTLIRCVNRLEAIQKGEIVVHGQSIGGSRVHLSRLRAEVGSSKSMMRGCMARARAMATRCCWPPERFAG